MEGIDSDRSFYCGKIWYNKTNNKNEKIQIPADILEKLAKKAERAFKKDNVKNQKRNRKSE